MAATFGAYAFAPNVESLVQNFFPWKTVEMAYSVEFRELMPEKRELKTNASFALNFPLKEFRITVFDPDGRKRVLSYSNDVATELVMPGNFATVQKASGDMGFPDVMAPWIDFHNGLTLQLSDELLKKAEIKESPNSIIIEEMEDSAKRFVFDAKTGFLLKVEFIAEYGGKSRVSMDYSLGNYGTFGTFRFPLEITQGFYNESGELTSACTYRIDPKSVRFNSAGRDSTSVFLPNGCKVDDRITGREYIVTDASGISKAEDVILGILDDNLNEAQEQKNAPAEKR